MTIVKMKKVFLIGKALQQSQIMHKIQSLGLLHIAPLANKPSKLASDILAKKQNSAKKLTRCIKFLQQFKSTANTVTAKDNNIDVDRVEELEKILSSKQNLATKINNKIKKHEPFGQFSIKDALELQEYGITIKLAIVDKKEKDLDKLKLNYYICSQNESTYWLALFLPKGQQNPLNTIKMPQTSLNQLKNQLQNVEQEIAEINQTIYSHAKHISDFKKELINAQNIIDLLQAQNDSKIDGPIFSLVGYLPADKQEKFAQKVEDMGAFAHFSDPQANEKVPVKIRNHWLISGFEAIVTSFSGIRYQEKDITWAVGILFVLFGSLCLLDAGYGLMLAALGFVMHTKGVKDFAKIFMITGAFSVVVGLLSGQVFGFLFGKHIFLNHPPIVPIATDPLSCFIFSIVVGFVVMLFSYGIAIWQNGIKTQATGSLLMIIGAGLLIISKLDFSTLSGSTKTLLQNALSSSSNLLIISAFLAWFLFPEQIFGEKSKAANIVWTLYSGITGLVQDVLSHMRLFGIALSGGILALVINKISMMMPLIFTVLFSLIGHIFVFLLALLSLYIHTNRLIFLEFGTKCIGGGNYYYLPLRRRKFQ